MASSANPLTDLFPNDRPIGGAWEVTRKPIYFPWQLGTGYLQLTSERLLFMRPRWLWRREELGMAPLSEIASAKGGNRTLNKRGVLMIHLRRGRDLKFYPIPLAPGAKEIAEEINAALTEYRRDHG
jgi:hypothetical protein